MHFCAFFSTTFLETAIYSVLDGAYTENLLSSNTVNIMQYCRLKIAIRFVSRFNCFSGKKESKVSCRGRFSTNHRLGFETTVGLYIDVSNEAKESLIHTAENRDTH